MAVSLGWLAGAASLHAQTSFSRTVFSQNFNSATSISSVSGNGVNQFSNTGNASPTNPASTYSISNGNLHYNRTSDPVNGGMLASVQATTTNFSGGAVTTPFRLDIGVANSVYNSAASGGGTTYNARFEVNSGTSQAVGFTIRQGDTTSTQFGFNSFDNSGKATGTTSVDVILFFNPTANPLTYTVPVDNDGTTRVLAAHTADAYFANFDAGYVTTTGFALPTGFTSLQNIAFTDVGYGPNIGSIDFTDIAISAPAVPEPASVFTLSLGFGAGLLCLVRRRSARRFPVAG